MIVGLDRKCPLPIQWLHTYIYVTWLQTKLDTIGFNFICLLSFHATFFALVCHHQCLEMARGFASKHRVAGKKLPDSLFLSENKDKILHIHLFIVDFHSAINPFLCLNVRFTFIGVRDQFQLGGGGGGGWGQLLEYFLHYFSCFHIYTSENFIVVCNDKL